MENIIEVLKDKGGKVYIQTHDYPDFDALASAHGLYLFFKHFDIDAKIIYCGLLTDFVKNALEKLSGYILSSCKKCEKFSFPIITVDTTPFAGNITKLDAEYLGFIDHHIKYCRTKKNYVLKKCQKRGSNSTIVANLLFKYDIPIDKNSASILAIGLITDTLSFYRGITKDDLKVYYELFIRMDKNIVNYLTFNKIKLNDLHYYRNAIDSLKVIGKFGLVLLRNLEDKNSLGIMGDFFLSILEIEVTILVNYTKSATFISIRSENEKISAENLVKTILQGKGSGGGHTYMAAGACDGFLDINEIYDIISKYEREV